MNVHIYVLYFDIEQKNKNKNNTINLLYLTYALTHIHKHTYDTHSAIILSSKELFHFWTPDSSISYECLAHTLTHARTHRNCYLMETQIYDKIKLALQKQRPADVQIP